MSNPRDLVLLLDIVNAAQRMELFTDGTDEPTFAADLRTGLADQRGASGGVLVSSGFTLLHESALIRRSQTDDGS